MDWRRRAQISADVVFFSYTSVEKVKEVDTVYVWDLDKTYLDTKFETLKGLLRTAFEKPFEKKNVPGTAALLRALEGGAPKEKEASSLPLYFITASPPQMEKKILDKLNLDQVKPYGIFCKDNLQNLRPKRLWRLTQQIGFKLQALLQLRLSLKADVKQVLFGDDSESDAIIYSLYSDICSRRLDRSEIRDILKSFRVVGNQVDTILELQSQVPMQDPVDKIYINLDADTDSEYYIKFGRRTLPSFSTFQLALDLFQDGRLKEENVIAVAQDMMTNFGFTVDEMDRSLDGLIRRQVLGEQTLEVIVSRLKENEIISEDFEPSVAPKKLINPKGLSEESKAELEGAFEPWVPERIDYLHDYR